MRKSNFIQPKEVALSVVRMAAFFDLKEDGSLDILVEYVYNQKETKFTYDFVFFPLFLLTFRFIPCDDKGDTTFLKVQVFTNCLDYKKCSVSGKQPGI